MLRIYANNTDITQYVDPRSINIREQLNDRANILSFNMNLAWIETSETIELYDVMDLVQDASSGQADIMVAETYPFHEVFRVGQQVTIDPKWAKKQITTIQSIDHTSKTITLWDNLNNNLVKGDIVWYLSFGGSVQNNPDEQLGHLDEFGYAVTVSDRTTSFNREVVVETFQNAYMRQIIGLTIYEFCAPDDEKLLDFFETARTQGGVGLAMTNDSTDRIQGTHCQKTGTSWAGVATRNKTLGSVVDLSSMDHVRLWNKITENNGNKVTDIKYRIGNDASNYYERSSPWNHRSIANTNNL